jgi:hypothetical protein
VEARLGITQTPASVMSKGVYAQRSASRARFASDPPARNAFASNLPTSNESAESESASGRLFCAPMLLWWVPRRHHRHERCADQEVSSLSSGHWGSCTTVSV